MSKLYQDGKRLVIIRCESEILSDVFVYVFDIRLEQCQVGGEPQEFLSIHALSAPSFH